MRLAKITPIYSSKIHPKYRRSGPLGNRFAPVPHLLQFGRQAPTTHFQQDFGLLESGFVKPKPKKNVGCSWRLKPKGKYMKIPTDCYKHIISPEGNLLKVVGSFGCPKWSKFGEGKLSSRGQRPPEVPPHVHQNVKTD